MNLFTHLKQQAKACIHHINTLYFAYRDPRMPLHAKMVTALVVAYALSPIDLIPDFIPVLGYLDDIVLLPLGIMLAIRMIPRDILDDSREKARELATIRPPHSKTGLCIIVFLWLMCLAAVVIAAVRSFR